MRLAARLALPALLLATLAAWPVAAWSDGDNSGSDGSGTSTTSSTCPRSSDDRDSSGHGTDSATSCSGTSGNGDGQSGSQSGGQQSNGDNNGNGKGNDDSPPNGPPQFARAVDARSVNGTIRVKVPGTDKFLPLSALTRLPSGAEIDATAGTVRLISPKGGNGRWQSAVFSGAVLTVVQKSAANPVTNLTLTGGDFSKCGNGARTRSRALATASRSRSVRRVRGSGHGRFRTRGRFGAASVRGTIWITEDRCDGTVVRVRRGRVAVRDFVRHKTIFVRAGHSYLARAPS